VDFETMMRLEAHGPDTFVGAGPQYPWGGLYGGQIVAQSLRAATATVDPAFRVHSLHAYFIRRGDHTEPIRFEVDRLRNGRSFVTRAVVARQSTGAILNMSASFQVDEEAPRVQPAAPPEIPGADEIAEDSWSEMFERRGLRRLGVGRSAAWLRLKLEPGSDLAACGLAYMSDDMPTDAVVMLHPAAPTALEGDWVSASLDHAIWFHRAVPAGWQLHSFEGQMLGGSRGLSIGQIWVGDVHVATVAQEVMLRPRRT
jgi:acyl-CoA thioesterase-2